MRPIDGDKLLEAIEKERQYLRSRGLYGAEHILVHNFRNLVEDAPTVDLKDIYQEGHYDGHIEGYTKAINEETSQSDIRWTDKVFVKSNGDIIDFEGRVVGHINLDIMKGVQNDT